MRATLLLAAAVLAAPALALGADFVGPENCRACHPTAYAAWKDSQHAQSTGSLSARQLADGRCLSCHAPDRSKGAEAVSCETCHGGGQFYSPTYVMKDRELSRAVGLIDPSERLCVKCHDANAPALSPFNFAEKLKALDHWSAERAERKAARDAAKAGDKGRKPGDRPR